MEFVKLIKACDVEAVKDFPISFRINETSAGYLGMAHLALGDAPEHIEMTKYLLSIGADPNEADELGRTPVHMAVLHGHVECLKLLLDAGGRISKKDKAGFTARNFLNYLTKAPSTIRRMYKIIERDARKRNRVKSAKPLIKRRKPLKP